MPRDDEAVLDIRDAATRIREFVDGFSEAEFLEGFSEAEFLEDARTQSAVLHQIMILGEAAKRVSRDHREAHPEAPWSLMAGMRDRLIHRYHDVDMGEVWVTVDRDIPDLLERIDPLVPDDG